MGHRYVIGIDEVGCGALVGPLVVCAVAFKADAERVSVMWKSLTGEKELVAGDSKGIKAPEHREALSAAIRNAGLSVAVIERSSSEIDRRLLSVVLPEAIALAAARCIERLKALDPSMGRDDVLVLIDGALAPPALSCEVRQIPGGDKSDWRVGAASIVAKAAHDKKIDALNEEYPRWGFDRSRGYPTKEHKALLAERGPTVAHRKSFRPVRDVMPCSLGIEE